MAVDYSSMTEEQIAIINEYCKNDIKKLKQICYTVWGKKGLPTCYHDDLYDDAMNVLSESVMTFNQNGKASFKTYLTNNIRMSYGQWYRDNFLRAKRNNLELDEKGNIRKDENENPIIIQNISFDAPVDDGIDLREKIASSSNIEDEVIGSDKKEFVSDKIRKYLNKLTRNQREVACLIMDGFSSEEIKEILHIEQYEFNDCLNGMKAYRNISILF